MPDFLALRYRAAITAGIVPLPGSARPMASVRQFMEFAVNIPAQDPHVGHAVSSIPARVSVRHLPGTDCAHSLKYRYKIDLVIRIPSGCIPDSIGPPLTIMAGMSSLAAAISIQHDIVAVGNQHQGIKCMGNGHDFNRIRDQFPATQGILHADVSNSQCRRTPRCRQIQPACPLPSRHRSSPPRQSYPDGHARNDVIGRTQGIPTNGRNRFFSSSIYPMDLKRARWGARSIPFFTLSLIMVASRCLSTRKIISFITSFGLKLLSNSRQILDPVSGYRIKQGLLQVNSSIQHLVSICLYIVDQTPGRNNFPHKGGMGFAKNCLPLSSPRISPVTISTAIRSSSEKESGTSSDSRIGSPILNAFL